MPPFTDATPLIQQAERFILSQPEKRIAQFEWNGQLVWMKRRPFSKKTHWHQLQGMLARLVKLPIFSSTAIAIAPNSLRHEAERLHHFFLNNIPVPRVLAVTETFMLTEDVGQQLQHYLHTLSDPNEVHRLLTDAMTIILQMHQAGLCHARPSLRDMTIKNNVISLIDLEEDPLKVMSLPQAQARDVWLFLNSAAQFCDNDTRLLQDLFDTYRAGMSHNTVQELTKMVHLLKPFRRLLDTPLKSKMGRDVQCAIKANKALERCL